MKLELGSLESAVSALERSLHAAQRYEATLPKELKETVRGGIIQHFEAATKLLECLRARND